MKLKTILFCTLLSITLFVLTSDPSSSKPASSFFSSIIEHFTDPVTGIKFDKDYGLFAIFETRYGRRTPSPSIIYQFNGLTIHGYVNKEYGLNPEETAYVFSVSSEKPVLGTELLKLLQHAQDQAEKTE